MIIEGRLVRMKTASAKWAGIESEHLNENNWVQVAFRWTENAEEQPRRQYLVMGKLKGEEFRELYDYDESKELAYQFFWEVLDKFAQ
jgi:hypothetical protein